MKKFTIALIVTLDFATSSFAASSDDIYVRKDVFDVHMLNINQNLERILSELQSQRNEIHSMRNDMRSELKQEIHELSKAIAVLSERTDRNFDILSARIDGTNSRIDDLRNGMYLWLVIIGTFITLVGVVIAWPRAKNFIQNRASQKHFLTLDEIEKLIDSKLKSKTM